VRPFVLGAKVSPLGCSRPLQRAIVDFAADQPFAQARAKLQEHYGFAIGESTIQRITFAHAKAMYEAGRAGIEFPEAMGLRMLNSGEMTPPCGVPRGVAYWRPSSW
jgi:hypothetical protein